MSLINLELISVSSWISFSLPMFSYGLWVKTMIEIYKYTSKRVLKLYKKWWKLETMLTWYYSYGFYSKCDQVFDLWQQLELASELESDLQHSVDWGRKWLVDLNAEKTQLGSFDWSSKTCYWCENGWACSWEKIIF